MIRFATAYRWKARRVVIGAITASWVLSAAACRSSRDPAVGVRADVAAPDAVTAPGACADTGCVDTVYDRRDVGAPRRDIAVDDTDVFWMELVVEGNATRGTRVMAGPKTGAGAPRTLGEYEDLSATNALALDATHAHWFSGGKIRRVPKGGGAGGDLALPPLRDPGPLVDAGDAILVASHGCRELARVPKDGTPGTTWPVTARPAAGGVTSLFVDDRRVLCSNGRAIHGVDLSSGAARELVAQNGEAGAVVAVDGALYWSSGPIGVSGLGHLFTASGDPPSQPRDLGDAFGAPARLSHDPVRRKLYWTTGLDAREASLASYDLRAGKIERVRADLNVYGNSATDATHVYWIASRAVMRLRK